ncbi:unnamed protein product [Cuscuta europaea]|uniref:Uncharacterized protein n=1 Tax=Cuscuta europaea TaxID=41803 RepID=A0A9P0ZHH1_CUSEU|nr:unnamed protein product [Cuscuta europaea]
MEFPMGFSSFSHSLVKNFEDPAVFANNKWTQLTTCSLSVNFTLEVWQHVRHWLKIRKNTSTVLSTVKLCIKEYGGMMITSKTILLAFCCTVYVVWKTRNQIIFSQKVISVKDVFLEIEGLVYKVLLRLYPSNHIDF